MIFFSQNEGYNKIHPLFDFIEKMNKPRKGYWKWLRYTHLEYTEKMNPYFIAKLFGKPTDFI